MGFNLCFRRCLNVSVFFPLFKQFLETGTTNHCNRMHFQESELVFCVMLKGKSGKNKFNVNLETT